MATMLFYIPPDWSDRCQAVLASLT